MIYPPLRLLNGATSDASNALADFGGPPSPVLRGCQEIELSISSDTPRAVRSSQPFFWWGSNKKKIEQGWKGFKKKRRPF